MKRSHSRRENDENEERYEKRKRNGDSRESRHDSNRKSSRYSDDYKSFRHSEYRSFRHDKYRSSRRSSKDHRNDDHRNSRNSEDKERRSPKEQIGTRYYGEPDISQIKQKRAVDLLTSRTGGAYIPPAKLRMLQAKITDKSGAAYQRIAWEALKKSIHGYINKVNTSNIAIITRELLRENIVRGRGLLARSIIQSQAASPTFTPVYAALVAIINSKFPYIGELLLKRLVLQFKRSFKRNDKPPCISAGTFIAHLINQQIAHEILALEILTLLLETPTDDSVEVAIAFLKECGMKLTEISRRGIEAIFEMLRNILHEGQLDKRVQYMIEVMFQTRKDGFKDHEAIREELDLVDEEDQFTHMIRLDEDKLDAEDILNVFRFETDYLTNEEKYKQLSKEILGSDTDSGDNEDGEEESSEENSDMEQAEEKESIIIDNTETNLTALRRTIYLTIHSSLDFEECAHKLMKMQLKPGQETELCHMFLDCCAEMRTYERFFGLLAGRFCAINKMYVIPFEHIFKDSYDTIHRLDINKLRNVSKFFAHLLFTDSISWEVLSCIKLNEEDTTSSSRIFIKILFQELSEYMGLTKLNERLKDVTLQNAFEGLFPRNDPKSTRFAINFFTSIGLGGLTDDLREHLKSHPKPTVVPILNNKEEESSSDESTSSSSSSSFTSEFSSSSFSSSSSEDEAPTKKKKNKKKEKRLESKEKEKEKYKKLKKQKKRKESEKDK